MTARSWRHGNRGATPVKIVVLGALTLVGIIAGCGQDAGPTAESSGPDLRLWYDLDPQFDYSYPESDPEAMAAWLDGERDEPPEAPQIRSEDLSSLSTIHLLDAVLDHEIRYRIGLDNTIGSTMGYMKDGFNGLRELLRRPDAGSVVLDVYERVRLEDVRCRSWVFSSCEDRYVVLELIAAERGVLESLGTEGRRRLGVLALERYGEWERNPRLLDYNGPLVRLLYNSEMFDQSANDPAGGVFFHDYTWPVPTPWIP
jgi:hypothetical protein